jgi:hypothetical protein
MLAGAAVITRSRRENRVNLKIFGMDGLRKRMRPHDAKKQRTMQGENPCWSGKHDFDGRIGDTGHGQSISRCAVSTDCGK